MPEAGRDEVHDQRIPVLQPDIDHQRGWSRGCGEGERERESNGVDELEQELGSKLAVKRSVGGAITVVQSHGQ